MELYENALAFKSAYNVCDIKNRRYLGNKYSLLPFIKRVVSQECDGIKVFADIFSGTGAVSSAFIDNIVITNDLMYSNYMCNYAWFGSETYDKEKIIDYIIYYNKLTMFPDNYMTENFSDTYFSREDCSRIGFIRENIEKNFLSKNINFRERAILITSLLYAMDKIANTCGHYDAYRKGAHYGRNLELCLPIVRVANNPHNKCYNEDANSLVKIIKADLVYIDPPYNSRQYCDTYHLLENVSLWEKPNLIGVAKKMERNGKKSRYCTKEATSAFEELIDDISARYILLSYNNMAQKGNGRSNAKIADENIMRILGKKGSVKVFVEQHRAFSAGKSNIDDNAERLFLCKCE